MNDLNHSNICHRKSIKIPTKLIGAICEEYLPISFRLNVKGLITAKSQSIFKYTDITLQIANSIVLILINLTQGIQGFFGTLESSIEKLCANGFDAQISQTAKKKFGSKNEIVPRALKLPEQKLQCFQYFVPNLQSIGPIKQSSPKMLFYDQ